MRNTQHLNLSYRQHTLDYMYLRIRYAGQLGIDFVIKVTILSIVESTTTTQEPRARNCTS